MLIHKKYIAHTLCILLFFTNEIKSQSHEGHDHSQPSKKEDTVKPTKELKKSNSKSVEVETVKPEIVPNEEIKPIDKKELENTQDNPHIHTGPITTPAGLMLPHIHNTKDWVIDYMYMQMDMRTLYNGNNKEDPGKYLAGIEYNPTISTIPATQVGTGNAHNHSGTTTNTTTPDPLPSYYIGSLNPNSYRYMSMPVSMKMEMTMISLMKNINDTQGIGDIGITLATKLLEKESHTINLQMGLTLPTGSIDEKNTMPLMGNVKSPYNMQLGTGTFNAIPGISYLFNKGKFTLGSFAQITLRNGKNDNGYRFGNRYEFSLWTSYILLDWLAPTLRITSTKWDNISGADPNLDPTMDPQNDPNRQGGRRVDLLAGVNFYIPSLSEKMKAGIEFGKPIHQHLNGPQMGANSLFNFRFQASF